MRLHFPRFPLIVHTDSHPCIRLGWSHSFGIGNYEWMKSKSCVSNIVWKTYLFGDEYIYQKIVICEIWKALGWNIFRVRSLIINPSLYLDIGPITIYISFNTHARKTPRSRRGCHSVCPSNAWYTCQCSRLFLQALVLEKKTGRWGVHFLFQDRMLALISLFVENLWNSGVCGSHVDPHIV